MENEAAILRAIYAAVDEYNEIHTPEEQLEKSTTTALLGESSKLTSLGLMSFIVSVEQKVNELLGRELNLVDDFLAAVDDHPIADIGALARHIAGASTR